MVHFVLPPVAMYGIGGSFPICPFVSIESIIACFLDSWDMKLFNVFQNVVFSNGGLKHCIYNIQQQLDVSPACSRSRLVSYVAVHCQRRCITLQDSNLEHQRPLPLVVRTSASKGWVIVGIHSGTHHAKKLGHLRHITLLITSSFN